MSTQDFASTAFQVVDHQTAEPPQTAHLAKLSAPLTSTLTGELDGAQWYLGVATEEILLAALGLAIARTIGEGVTTVDVAGHGAIPLTCVTAQHATQTEMLGDVVRTMAAGPTAPRLAAKPHSDVFFSYLGSEPGLRHALELRAYRADDVVQLDWWYDTRSFDRHTVEELAEQLPFALIQLTSEAAPPLREMAVAQ
jgi:hypothetical protein